MSYAILVGDVLIRVARGHEKPIEVACEREVDESYLLQVLKGIWASPLRLLRYLTLLLHEDIIANLM